MKSHPWTLRFKHSQIESLASRYQDAKDPDAIAAGQRACEAGFFNREDFLVVCDWKSPRRMDLCRANTEQAIEEVTRVALSTTYEPLRLLALTSLQGIGFPMASVFLHLAHRDCYPIVDFRALWSWGFDTPPTYTLAFWAEYVQQRFRELVSDTGLSPRVVDCALWQYSKENQK